MKKLLSGLVLLTSFTAFSAQANESNSSYSDPSYFDILGDMYDEGTVPDISELVGVVRTGRCFSRSYPSTPKGAAMTIFRSPEDVGPVGDLYPKYGFRYKTSSYSDTYDDLEEISFPYATAHRYIPESAYAYNSSYDYSINFTVNDDYIIQEYTYNNEVTERCYYYNPGYGNNSSL